MKSKLLKSYAKINLSLDILGRNKNNLHNIQSIISFINLHDIIFIKNIKSKKHIIKFNGLFSKNLENNSISQLIRILDKKKLLKNKYKIEVTKNIPQKSGLGGGSMNAATTLMYLLRREQIYLQENEILSICNQIGSDVMLGLDPKNLILKNNIIKKFNNKLGFHTVLIKPKIGCSTKKIYGKFKIFSKNRIKLSKGSFKIQSLQNAQNDLEKPAFKLYPILKKLKTYLLSIEKVKFVRMTGSGSAIVAYFSNKKSAKNALKLLKTNFKNYWSILSKTI